MFKNCTFYETWKYIFVYKKADYWILFYITLIHAECYNSANKLATSYCKFLNNKMKRPVQDTTFLLLENCNVQGTTNQDGVFQFLNVLKELYKANKLNPKTAKCV